MFEMLWLAKDRGIISSNAVWSTASGEITIHPYKDRLYELLKGCRTSFLTNGFLYDEKLAENLHEVSLSTVCVSLDAGTRQTYQAVKGFDKLEQVVDNLTKYRKASLSNNPVILKYIILPGINDTLEDYEGLMRILHYLDLKYLTISADAREKYMESNEKRKRTIQAAIDLCRLCNEHSIIPQVMSLNYTLDEIDEIKRHAAIEAC